MKKEGSRSRNLKDLCKSPIEGGHNAEEIKEEFQKRIQQTDITEIEQLIDTNPLYQTQEIQEIIEKEHPLYLLKKSFIEKNRDITPCLISICNQEQKTVFKFFEDLALDNEVDKKEIFKIIITLPEGKKVIKNYIDSNQSSFTEKDMQIINDELQNSNEFETGNTLLDEARANTQRMDTPAELNAESVTTAENFMNFIQNRDAEEIMYEELKTIVGINSNSFSNVHIERKPEELLNKVKEFLMNNEEQLSNITADKKNTLLMVINNSLNK